MRAHLSNMRRDRSFIFLNRYQTEEVRRFFEVQDANSTDPEGLRQKSEVALTAGPLSGSRSEGAMGTEPHFHPADINLIQ